MRRRLSSGSNLISPGSQGWARLNRRSARVRPSAVMRALAARGPAESRTRPSRAGKAPDLSQRHQCPHVIRDGMKRVRPAEQARSAAHILGGEGERPDGALWVVRDGDDCVSRRGATQAGRKPVQRGLGVGLKDQFQDARAGQRPGWRGVQRRRDRQRMGEPVTLQTAQVRHGARRSSSPACVP